MSDNRILIPYGVERWTDDYLTPGAPAECRVPHVTVDRDAGGSLRLRDGGYDFAEAPSQEDLADPAAQLAFLAAHAERHCSLWGKFQKMFVQLYFSHVRDEVETHRGELAARAQAFGGLYSYRDWLFSAQRPLPLAHLRGADGAMIPVDFAFWTNGELLAVDIAKAATPGPAQQARARALDDAGILRREMPQAALASRNTATFRAALPGELIEFWRNDPIPGGPFVPATLSRAAF